MQYRAFGKTDLKVSEIGIGGQSLGGGLYYRNDKETILMLQEALERGINFYDTSDHYSQGQSEIILGRAFQGRRDKAIFATKIGTTYSALGRFALNVRPLIKPFSQFIKKKKLAIHRFRASQRTQDFSPAYLTRAVEASLRRLRTDYIDLIQLHKPPVEVLERAEFLGVFEKLKKAGKIRYYGISCAIEDQIRFARLSLKLPEIAAIQLQVNLLDETFHEILPECRRQNIALVARNPRAQGFLTNELTDIMAETYSSTDAEERDKTERAKKFLFLVKDNRTLAQAAMQYLLTIEGVSLVMPRVFHRKGLQETLGTLQAPKLTPEEIAQINAIRGISL